MAKSRKSKKSTKQRKAEQAARAASGATRRSFMAYLPYILGGVVLAAGLGFWGVQSVQAHFAEQDTSIVGQGTPTIVQVHDVTCSSCVNLQRETRAALAALDEGEIHYRVANLTTEEGLAFASKYGASYTTLLLFDGDGTLSRRITGETPRSRLREVFLAHVSGDSE
ncbi:thioredoxin family protein [Alphaproteobacteria bacterium KMM 3653]|uniref:Thioredoxin family protein n=1 Tax=Harenicola maris TaxID=2841044 RepID=A0AAP2CPR5_9RHOB|nr:thioredoxin family protein [Harenicola maris]